jgi:L-ascorbate metabolism protein UlaG (beta-lactamase superfamily)
VKILVDPWLEGKLTFVGQTWFFEGEKPGLKGSKLDIASVLEGVDLILLSQSLDDHTHHPTLKMLPKNIPVVAGPAAAEIARGLGFISVHSLDHGDQVGSSSLWLGPCHFYSRANSCFLLGCLK